MQSLIINGLLALHAEHILPLVTTAPVAGRRRISGVASAIARADRVLG